jgi:uncharacterized membrane protein YozB (DUF420 family)
MQHDTFSDEGLDATWSRPLSVTRLGFLGNRAAFAADVNLIRQIVALSFLLAGLYFVRSGRLKTHGRLMKSAIVFQFAALIV